MLRLIFAIVIAAGGAGQVGVAESHPSQNGRPVVTDLSQVASNPLAYDGAIFQGYVYVYPTPSYYAVLPHPLDPAHPDDDSDITFLTGTGQWLGDVKMGKLKAGDRLRVRATLSPDRPCFSGAFCAPFSHPIALDDLEVLAVGGESR